MTALSLRSVRADDYDEIERLKRQHGLGAYTREEWAHLFEHNPLFGKRQLRSRRKTSYATALRAMDVPRSICVIAALAYPDKPPSL